MTPFLTGKTIVRIRKERGDIIHKWKEVNGITIKSSDERRLLSTERRKVRDLDVEI